MPNPPPNRIPLVLQKDPEIRAFFEQLVNFLTPVQSGEGVFAITPANGVFIVGNGIYNAAYRCFSQPYKPTQQPDFRELNKS